MKRTTVIFRRFSVLFRQTLLLLVLSSWNINRAHSLSTHSCATTNVSEASASVCRSDETASSSFLLSQEVVDAVRYGGVGVVPNWLPPSVVAAMRRDARTLFAEGRFAPDGLTNTSRRRQSFREEADRQTFRGAAWDDPVAGHEPAVRRAFSERLDALRRELSARCGDRPSLASVAPETHETTYNWYANGASLGRHVDERHEETKGARGWTSPTRRSVTWLVYLNDEDWDASRDGGALRCFPRSADTNDPVGAHKGDLQIGWLRRANRPVFLDALSADGGTASLYVLTNDDDGAPRRRRRTLVSERNFLVPASGADANARLGDFLAPRYRDDFEPIRGSGRDGPTTMSDPNDDDREHVLRVSPTAGTLVLFDSVSLPHLVEEVTTSVDRPRIAATGWFHEESQFVLPS